MKRTLFGALAAALLAAPAAAETITLRADQWCPYNCEPESAQEGYVIELAKEILGKAGHKVEYRLMPWSRALAEVKEGKESAAVGATRDDAEGFVFGEEPIGISVNAFGVPAGHAWRYKGLESFASVKLGLIKDYAYGEPLDGFVKANEADKNRIEFATGDNALETNIRKLVGGRLDVLVDEFNVLVAKVAQMQLKDKVEVVDSIGSPNPIYIAWSPARPGSAALAKALDDGIRERRTSGALAALLAKYGLKDWK